MASFFYEWDDFRGGYYVGASDIMQPKNTWKGANICLADDDATLIPTYEPTSLTLSGTQTSGGLVSFSSQTTWSNATYFNGYIVVTSTNSTATYVHFINTSTGAVTSVSLGVAGASSVGTAPIVIADGSDVQAFVVIGTVNIYNVKRSTATYATYRPINNTSTILLTGLTLWNARMIAWGSASDQFVFSDALTFAANWPSLNYASVGYANDGISYCVPRNLDLVVVKPSGWYSVTGVLGVNTSIRQINDSLGILSTDPAEQHNNVLYFTSATGYQNYAINLMAISGSRVDVVAYQRFGIGDANLRLSRTNLGYLTATTVYTDPDTNNKYVNAFLLDLQDRWQVLQAPATITSAQNLTFSFARGQVTRYNNAQDQFLYLIETSSGSTTNKLAVRKFRPNAIEPGKLANSSNPASAVLKLADITTKTPMIVRRVYVEAEMMQIPSDPYTGSSSIQAKVNNKSVSDISFSQTIGDITSGYSTAYTYPFSSFTAATNGIYSQTRTIRFNVDNGVWGYANEIEIAFSGLRIKRIWIEGDSR